MGFSKFIELYIHDNYLFQNIFITPRGTPSPHCSPSPFPSIPSPWQPPTCSLSRWVYRFWTFHINGLIQCVASVSGFFQWASCFPGSSTLQPESVSHAFLRPNEIPLCGYITFCFSLCLWMDIWIFPTFWLLWLVLPWTFLGTFLCRYTSSFLLCVTEIAGSYGKPRI